jgi:predicted secreted protein
VAKVAFVAHCVLNQNSRVAGGAYCPGVYSPFVEELRGRGWRLMQLPCPELAFAGLNRFWAVREQYDTIAFRRHCRRIVGGVAGAVAAHLARGDEVVLVGVDGSPTMGVHVTSSDTARGGRPQWPDGTPELDAGPGILIEELVAELAARGIEQPRAFGVTHQLPDHLPEDERAQLGDFLEG